MKRRVPSLVVMVVALAAIVLVGRTTPAEITPVFSAVAAEWMPVAPRRRAHRHVVLPGRSRHW